MKASKFLLTTVILFVAIAADAPRLSRPKTIKAEGDYTHTATSTVFPASIDDYQRTEVTTFDKQRTEIAARYEQKGREGKTIVTVYVYPAEEMSNLRFRSQYLASTQSIAIAADRELEAIQTYRSVAKDGYKIHGFNAFIADRKQNTALELYECGDWFFKIRTTSDRADSTDIYRLNEKIVQTFDPVNLVKHSSFTPQSTITFNQRMFADSLLMGITIARALEELKWAQDNVDSLEQVAGFPSLYLEMHVSSLKKAVEFADENQFRGVGANTSEFVRQLRAIISNNYLEQFVLEQYDMLLTSHSPEKTFNLRSYWEWKKKNNININLNNRMYVINFPTGKGSTRKR